jgi:hypothetical protein
VKRAARCLVLVVLVLMSVRSAALAAEEAGGLAARVDAITGRSADIGLADEILPDLGGWRCGSSVISDAAAAWDGLTAGERSRIGAALAVGGAANPPFPAPRAGKARIPRPGHDTPFSWQSEHFNLKWGSVNPPTTETVENIAAGLEESWAAQVGEQGYPVPTNSDAYYLDVYFGNTGAEGENVPTIPFVGAYAAVYWGESGREEPFMAYIVFHPDMIVDPMYARVVAAHEFFHTVQSAIQDLIPGANQDAASRWFVESSATWITELVYPDFNDYIRSLAYYMEHPAAALHDLTDGAHPYSMCIWEKYIEENYGGPEAIHALWTDPDPDGVLVGTDKYVAGAAGIDLKEAFRDFLARVATRDFAEGDQFAEVLPTSIVTQYPHVRVEEDLEKDKRPRMLGANFHYLAPPAVPGMLRIDFRGRRDKNDLDIDWLATLVMVDEDGGYAVYPLETADETEDGVVEAPDFGGTWKAAWFIAAPYPGDLTRVLRVGTALSFEYAWAARMMEPEGDDDADDDDGGDSGGCGQ